MTAPSYPSDPPSTVHDGQRTTTTTTTVTETEWWHAFCPGCRRLYAATDRAGAIASATTCCTRSTP